MKNYMRKYAALALFAAMAFTSVAGCAEDDESSASGGVADLSAEDETVVLRSPLTFNYNSESVPENATSGNLDAADPTAPADENSEVEYVEVTDANGENVTEYIDVTDAEGENVTEYVEVTDANGVAEKDENGEPVTEAVQVTTAVNVTEPVNGSGDNSDNNGYIPYTDSAYAMWIDISKDADFEFQDAFISVTFKVKENIPDGEYPVTVSNPDFSSLKNGVTGVDPDIVQNGIVYVNKKGTAQKEFTEDDGFVVYVDNVECKQGDEITVNFNMKNNPGMVGMNFWFDYDKNAMDIVKCRAVGEFGEIARAGADFGKEVE